jgi:hypothetical protein
MLLSSAQAFEPPKEITLQDGTKHTLTPEELTPRVGLFAPLRDKVTSSRLIAPCWSPQAEDRVTVKENSMVGLPVCEWSTLTGRSARAWIENCQTPQRVDEGLKPVG